MSITGPVLVFLANGVQGSATVRAAQRRGHRVRALVRSLPRSNAFASTVEVVRGDLNDPASLIAATRGVAHVVLQLPTGPEAEMVAHAAHALNAIGRAGVRSIVLKLASASRPAPCAEPSFVANAAIERMVRDAGIPAAIVRPTLYLDNLLKPSALADIREGGVFSPPIDAHQTIAWTCADDCAEAAVRLLEHGCDGGDHRIAGPQSVSGKGLAAHLSAGIGRPITYRAQSVEAFEHELDSAMGPDMARRIAGKFRYFRDDPRDASRILANAFEPSPALPGFVPTTIEAWAIARRASFRPMRE